MMSDTLARELASVIGSSPFLAEIIGRWPEIGLPDAWLVAGAVAQTVWNRRFGLPATHGIADVDLAYFDTRNLSEEGEADHAARIAALFRHLPVRLDVKNEARVHLWYERKFGYPITSYRSVEEAIATFPTTASAVGVRPAGNGLDVIAPFGLADMQGGIVRPNKVQITPELYAAKVTRWLACWPGLTVVDWDAADLT